MRVATRLALSWALALGACVPDHVFDRDGAADGADVTMFNARGDGGMDAGCTTPTTIRITNPMSSTVHTSRGVAIQAVIDGCPPDTVSVEVDGRTLVSDLPPPYLYMFDTSMLTEQVYDVVFVAMVGGMRVMSPTLTVVVDHTPPMVTMHTPALGATNVVYHAPISITFSESMDPASVSPSTFSIAPATPAGATLTWTPTWNADNTVLTLALGPAPTFPNTLTETLMPSIHDLAGNALSLPMQPFQWSVPVWSPLGAGISGGSPSTGTTGVLRLRSDGTPVLAYSSNSGTGDHIQLATWNGMTWTPLGTPESVSSTARIQDLAAILDSSGNPYVVWVEMTGASGGDVYAAHFDGTSWSLLGSGPLNFRTSTQGFSPAVALDSSGTPYAAWSETAILLTLPTIRRWNGTSWADVAGAQILQPSGMSFADMPEIAIDPGGNIFVASLWKANTSGAQYHLYVHELASGAGSWSMLGTGMADPSNASDEHISMLVDALSHPTVAWTRFNASGGTEIGWTTFNGSTFGTDGFMHSNGSGSSAHAHSPWARYAAMSTPALAWTESDSLYVTEFSSGVWHTYATPFSNAGTQPLDRLTGEFDSFGEAVMAWTRSDPAGSGRFDIFVNVANR